MRGDSRLRLSPVIGARACLRRIARPGPATQRRVTCVVAGGAWRPDRAGIPRPYD